MLQAIVTKYHGPTNHRAARISARADAGKTSVAYDHGKSPEDNHNGAAQALAYECGWTTEKGRAPLVGGALPGNAGYAFVIPRNT
jgi:hypothetical protein